MTVKALANATDAAAGAVVIGSLAEWLPPIAAFLSIVWLLIRIYEHARWVRKGRPPRN